MTHTSGPVCSQLFCFTLSIIRNVIRERFVTARDFSPPTPRQLNQLKQLKKKAERYPSDMFDLA